MSLYNQTSQSRRKFFTRLATMSGCLCYGCRLAFAKSNKGQTYNSPEAKHKFFSDSGMSYEEVFKFSYNQMFIPFMKWLGTEIGEDRLLEFIRKWTDDFNANRGPQLNYNMRKFIEIMKRPDTFYDHVTTVKIIEESEHAFAMKTTECLWAKVFREADASAIGYSFFCYSDYAKTKRFNPKLKLLRTKTLMQGDDYCDHRFIIEE
jgi:hypothetical protein